MKSNLPSRIPKPWEPPLSVSNLQFQAFQSSWQDLIIIGMGLGLEIGLLNSKLCGYELWTKTISFLTYKIHPYYLK